MNTLRTLRYAHYTDLYGIESYKERLKHNGSESYKERLKRINQTVIIFSKFLMDEILFYNGWVGYGKE